MHSVDRESRAEGSDVTRWCQKGSEVGSQSEPEDSVTQVKRNSNHDLESALGRWMENKYWASRQPWELCCQDCGGGGGVLKRCGVQQATDRRGDLCETAVFIAPLGPSRNLQRRARVSQFSLCDPVRREKTPSAPVRTEKRSP